MVWRDYTDFPEQKPASKGGMTGQKLPLYLAEYAGRYNHCNGSDKIRIRGSSSCQKTARSWIGTFPLPMYNPYSALS